MDPQRVATTAIEWAAAEGWNPGLDDGQRFLASDPGAFIGSKRDGEVAGTVSCALYGPSYAFIGFYIVRADLRGQGIGTQLFDQALARAGKRVIGLDGVLEQQPVYASLGFELSHRNERWRGTGGGERPAGLTDVRDADFGGLQAYDREVFGADREQFLRAWIERDDGHALVAEDMRGYAVLRHCRDGMKVGPLFADGAEVAETLLAGMRAAAGDGTPLFLDVPHANPDALALARMQMDEPVFETARMYRGGRPPEDLSRVFGVTSFEFG